MTHHKLSYFPTALPGETLGARVARFHVHSVNFTTQKTFNDLFSAHNFNLNQLVPPHIDRLASRLPGETAAVQAELLRQHTIAPVLAFFGSVARGCANRKRGPVMYSGHRVVGSDPVTQLCMDCLHEDIAVFGSSRIQLAHQVPGVKKCWKHGRQLVWQCPQCGCPFDRPNDLLLFPVAGCVCGFDVSQHSPSTPKLDSGCVQLSFAQFVNELILGELPPKSLKEFTQALRRRARDLGYGIGTQRLDVVRFRQDFVAAYGEEYVQTVDYSLGQGRQSGWAQVLSASAGHESPVHRRMLVAHFLFGDVRCLHATLNCPQTKNEQIPYSIERKARSVLPAAASLEPRSLSRIGELIAAYGYDSLEQIWGNHYGLMKVSVRKPGALTLIRKMLNQRTRADKRAAISMNEDEQYVCEVERVAGLLYESEGKPVRISANRILEQIPKGYRLNTLKNRYPKAIAALARWIESGWHFYARRMIWALWTSAPADADWKIVTSSGVPWDKARALKEWLHTRVAVTGPDRSKRCQDILFELNLPKDWTGPCPERVFSVGGRAFYRSGR